MALYSGELSSHELFDAQADVWNHIFNFIYSMSLKSALQLGIPDVIYKHGKPITFSELIDNLPINKSKSSSMYRLMRLLVQSKLFIKVKIDATGEDGYWLTPASRLLLSNDPLSLAPYANLMLNPNLIAPWHSMSEWLQNDTLTPIANTYKKPCWDYVGGEPIINQLFNEAMACDSRLLGSILVRDCKQVFEGLKSIVDVAGGTGTMAKLIVDSFPGMKCAVMDLPHVVDGLEGNENLTFVVGDMFKSIPPADAIFIKWIFHNWSDEECITILKNCKEAIPSKENGGKVIIVDMVMGDENEDQKVLGTQRLYDMMMMNFLVGTERTEREWAKLFSDSGFTGYNITHALGVRSLIELFP